MSRGAGRLLFVLCLVVLLARTAAGQETISYASVSGRVTDPTGQPVAGAAVTARQIATNVTSGASTDGDGRFRFPFLRVGSYEIRVRQPGFADATRAVTLTVGAAFDLPIALALESVSASVSVTDEAPVLETARTQIAATVSLPEIKAVPLNGRNFLDLALLVPGVSPTNVGGGTQLFAETSAVPGVGLSVGSQRNFSNNFIVDGLSDNDDAAGLSGTAYGVDALDQFQIVTSGGQAELGRALGGYVNAVTRSGTNAFQGDVYDFARNQRFNAANPLLAAVPSPAVPDNKLPMSQAQYGASVGGPIVRDRTFFFANVERRVLDQSGLVTISSDNVNSINARLAAAGYQGPMVATGIYANPIRTTNVFAKIDHELSRNDHVTVRLSTYDVHATNSRGAGGTAAPSASAALANLDRTLAVSNVIALSGKTVNETRAQVAWSDLSAPPTDTIGPAVSISGIATFGTLSGSPTQRHNMLAEVVDSVTHQAGAHAVRLGVDVLYNDDTITFPRQFRGSYAFSSLANFLSGSYNNAGFTQTFGASVVSQRNPNVGLYAQDEWQVTPRLTLNAGLRYDLQFLQAVATDTNNVAPRLGFAWLPSASRRLVVRGNAGVFYDRIPLRAVANALLSAGNTTHLGNLQQISVSLSPGQAAAPVFPNVLAASVPSVTLVNFTTIDPHIRDAYSEQGSIEIERQVGASGTISVGYEHSRGRELIVQVNQNVPSCTAAGTNNGCRPNATYANDNQYSSIGSSVYDGLHVAFVERPSGWGSYRVAYTWSKAMNNVGEAFFNSPINPFDISQDWSRSDDDQRHRLVVSGEVASPSKPATRFWSRVINGFQASWMVQYYSALPLNITSGVTTVQGTAGRPVVNGVFISRNTGRGPDFFSVNVRLARTFHVGRTRLQALVEAFNLTNRENVVTYNGNFGAGAYPATPATTFGQVTAVGDPRSLQFGLRATF